MHTGSGRRGVRKLTLAGRHLKCSSPPVCMHVSLPLCFTHARCRLPVAWTGPSRVVPAGALGLTAFPSLARAWFEQSKKVIAPSIRIPFRFGVPIASGRRITQSEVRNSVSHPAAVSGSGEMLSNGAAARLRILWRDYRRSGIYPPAGGRNDPDGRYRQINPGSAENIVRSSKNQRFRCRVLLGCF